MSTCPCGQDPCTCTALLDFASEYTVSEQTQEDILLPVWPVDAANPPSDVAPTRRFDVPFELIEATKEGTAIPPPVEGLDVPFDPFGDVPVNDFRGHHEHAVSTGKFRLEEFLASTGDVLVLGDPTRIVETARIRGFSEPSEETTPTPVEHLICIGADIERMLGEETVLARYAQAPEVELSGFEAFVLQQLDGVRSTGELGVLTGLSTGDLRIALALLADKGQLVQVRRAPAPARPARSPADDDDLDFSLPPTGIDPPHLNLVDDLQGNASGVDDDGTLPQPVPAPLPPTSFDGPSLVPDFDPPPSGPVVGPTEVMDLPLDAMRPRSFPPSAPPTAATTTTTTTTTPTTTTTTPPARGVVLPSTRTKAPVFGPLTVLRRTTPAPAAPLSPFEQHVLQHVDGHRAVNDLTEATGLAAHDLIVALEFLVTKGMVEVGWSAGAAPSMNRAPTPGAFPGVPPPASAVGMDGVLPLPGAGLPPPTPNPVTPPGAHRRGLSVTPAARAPTPSPFVSAPISSTTRLGSAPTTTPAPAPPSTEIGTDSTEPRPFASPRAPSRGASNVEGLLHAATRAEQDGDMERAVFHLRRAAEVSPNSPVVFNRLGIALARQKDLRGATNALGRALELAPDDPTIVTNFTRLATMADRAEQGGPRKQTLWDRLKR